MSKAISIIFVLVGLLNFVPVIGVISGAQLESMYAVDLASTDLVVLMRHRAVMLGLIGGLMIYAAFRPALQWLAAMVGLTSMLAFVVLAHLPEAINNKVHNVAFADIFGALAMLIAIGLMVRQQKSG